MEILCFQINVGVNIAKEGKGNIVGRLCQSKEVGSNIKEKDVAHFRAHIHLDEL